MERVQSPAEEMTIDAPGSEGLVEDTDGFDGNVAKGCHSLKGLDEMDRQEKRWIGCGNDKQMACEESTCAVKVQRRRRSHGYMSDSVISVKFQNVASWIKTSPISCCGDEPWDARRTSCVQNKATQLHPRKRCVISNVLWNFVLIAGRERMRITSKSSRSTHAITVIPKSDASFTNIQLIIAVNAIHHTVPATAAPLCRPP
jgi:hypothetical protein